MMSDMNNRQNVNRLVKGVLPSAGLLLLLGTIWGSGYSLARFATTHGVTPLGYAFWQTLGPILVLSIGVIYQGDTEVLNRFTLIFYLVTGLFGIAIPNIILYYTSALLPAGILSVVMNITPVFTYSLALMMAIERIDIIKMLGVVICVLGLMFLVLLRGPIYLQPFPVNGVLLALVSPLCFSLTAVYISKYRPKNTSSLMLARGMLISAFLFIVPVVFFSQSFYKFSAPWHMRDTVILLEMVLSSIGYLVLFRLLKRAGAVYYSLVSGVVAITGLFWGIVVFKEHYHAWTWGAIVLIVIGIGIVTIRLYYTSSRYHLR